MQQNKILCVSSDPLRKMDQNLPHSFPPDTTAFLRSHDCFFLSALVSQDQVSLFGQQKLSNCEKLNDGKHIFWTHTHNQISVNTTLSPPDKTKK